MPFNPTHLINSRVPGMQNRLEIVSVLGIGSFSYVFKAVEPSGEEWAVKVRFPAFGRVSLILTQ